MKKFFLIFVMLFCFVPCFADVEGQYKGITYIISPVACELTLEDFEEYDSDFQSYPIWSCFPTKFSNLQNEVIRYALSQYETEAGDAYQIGIYESYGDEMYAALVYYNNTGGYYCNRYKIDLKGYTVIQMAREILNKINN